MLLKYYVSLHDSKVIFTFINNLGCHSFCHPSVACKVNEGEQIMCGSCPEGLTGNGVDCYPGMIIC